MKERPAGITILAGAFIVLGVLSLIWSGLLLGIGGLSALFGSLFGAEAVSSFGSSSAWSGYLGILTAIVQVVVGFGLLGMKRWAWILALVGIGLTIIQGVIGIILGGLFGFICGSLWLIAPILVLIYLLSRGVRSVFL